jgi:putative peptide zinc metalloprotease protein
MTGVSVSPPASSSGASPASGGARVALRPLSMRQDGDSWVIGRIETGDFIVVPAVAHRAITLLASAHTLAETAQALKDETGTDIAVADFVASLDDLGFVAAIDGEAREGPAGHRPTLPWLRPQHVRWLLHPVTAWLALAVITAAAVMMIIHPALVPSYRDLVWSRHTGIVLAVNAAIGWSIVWLHEVGHLTTARAAGVPARMSLSTRLQFLAAQTDVSGVWAAPRRIRMTVYLAGITVNLLITASCVLIQDMAGPAGLIRQILAAITLESLLFLPVQLLIFMRTDVYFLIQDLAGCANLYADGSAHVRYLARRAWRGIRPRGQRPPSPTQALPRRERRAVHAYSWLLLSGTTASIAVAACVTLPAGIALAEHAAGEVAAGSPIDTLDGVAALTVVGGFQIIWLRTWWRRHGGQVRAYLRTRPDRSDERR